MKKNFTDLTYGSIAVLGGGALFLSSTIASGIYVGMISTLGVGLLLIKLKDSSPWLFNWILRHNIMSDLVLSVLLVFIMGTSTVTSIIAGASAALFCSAGLMYLNKIFIKNPKSSDVLA